MLIKSKKATIIYWTLFGMMIALVMYITISSSQREITRTYKGEVPISLLKTEQIAENKLLYVDLSAEHSAQKAVSDLIKKGGFYNISPCKDNFDYALWNKENKTCIPAPKQNLLKLFEENFNDYIIKAPFKDKFERTPGFSVFTKFTQPDYDFSVKNTNLLGIANTMMEFSFYLGENFGVKQGTYYANPSFKTDIGFDIREYEDIEINTGDMVSACRGKNQTQLLACIKENLPDKWELKQEFIFSEKEQQCLNQRKIMEFILGKPVNCVDCPSDAACERYIDEKYCNLDPCVLHCAWKQGKCIKLPVEQIKKIYIINPRMFNFEIKSSANINHKIALYFPVQYLFLIT